MACRSAFTLLELLLATSVLASMSVLMGTMLVHARSWRDGGDRLHATLTLPRVTALLQRQWSERRVLTGDGAGFIAEPTRLQFVCSAPLLDPQWPLVRVSYRIEPEIGTGKSGVSRWNLVYEEHRVTDVTTGATGGRQDLANGFGTDPHRLVLLASCAELGLEWFGREVQDEEGSSPSWNTIKNTGQTLTPALALRLIGHHQGESFSCVLATTVSRSSSF